MNQLKIFSGIFLIALLALGACDKDENEENPVEYDETYYAANATVSSSDPNFTFSNGNATVTFPFVGGEVVIDISCGTDWKATVEGDWLSANVNVTGGTLVLRAAENTGEEIRTSTITVSTAKSGIEISKINVIQATQYDEQYYADNASISCDNDLFVATDNGGEVTFTSSGGKLVIDVNCGVDWTATSGEGWLSANVDIEYGTLTLTAEKNENHEDRTTTVSLATTESGIQFATISVTELAVPSSALIFGNTITSANTRICLPLSGTLNCTVDWGDGSKVEDVSSSFPYHTYAETGEYDVIVDGTVTSLDSYNVLYNDRDWLTSVKQWGSTGLLDLSYAFYYCKELKSVAGDTDGSFANLWTVDYAFIGCYALEEIPEDLFAYCSGITSFDWTFTYSGLTSIPESLFAKCGSGITSFSNTFMNTDIVAIPEGLFSTCTNVTSFIDTFAACYYLKEIPEKLFENCTAVESFGNTFGYCFDLTYIPEGLFAKCTNVKSFDNTFCWCESLTTIPEKLFEYNTNATSFSGIFSGDIALATVPEGLFSKCIEVTSFSWMFSDCYELNTVPGDLFSNNTKVTDFSYLFNNCSGLASVPESLFAKCPDVTSFSWTFAWNESLKSIPEELFKNNTAVIDFSYVFNGCTSLASIPGSLFANCPNVTNFTAVFAANGALTSVPEYIFSGNLEVTTFGAAFRRCSALTIVPVGVFDNNTKVADFSNAFLMCSEWKGESPYSTIDGVNVHLYERENYPDQFADVYGGYCYTGCEGLTDYDSIPDDWKASIDGLSTDQTDKTGEWRMESLTRPTEHKKTFTEKMQGKMPTER